MKRRKKKRKKENKLSEGMWAKPNLIICIVKKPRSLLLIHARAHSLWALSAQCSVCALARWGVFDSVVPSIHTYIYVCMITRF